MTLRQRGKEGVRVDVVLVGTINGHAGELI
jgi:hypothetical protein